jgi:nucleotide-binding universal stress UspA family protein
LGYSYVKDIAMKIKKILWATDGSKESDSALRYATFLAEKLGAEIVCLFVSEISFPITNLYPIPEDIIIEIAEKTENKFENKFKRLSKRLKKNGINSTYKIIRDNTRRGIIKTLRTDGCDLIIMGKHGRGFFEKLVLGSNTAKVIKSSPVPVLSIPGRAKKSIDKIENILVPVDVSNNTESAILEALEFAELFKASVTLLYVFWLDEKAYDIPPSMVQRFMSKAHKLLDRKANQVKKKFLRTKNRSIPNIETEVIHGMSPASAIRGYVDKHKFDFIIMNTHGRKGVKRIILGSDAERVIREAPCPVLVVKP